MTTTILSTGEFEPGVVVRLVDPSGNAHSFVTVTELAGGGITQLTGDVTAGPGTGSQAATVKAISGNTAGVVPIVSPLDYSAGAVTFVGALIRFPASGSAEGIYGRGSSADIQLLALTGDAVDIGADGSPAALFLDSGGSLGIGGTHATDIEIGASTNNTGTAVDARANGGAVRLATASDVLQLGGTGPTQNTLIRLLPIVVAYNGGQLQVDSGTGALQGTGLREDVLASGTGVSVPNGPGVVNTATLTPAPGATLRIELFCSNLTPGETIGYNLASDTIAAQFINNGGNFIAQIANRSGGGARTVNYRVIQTSPA